MCWSLEKILKKGVIDQTHFKTEEKYGFDSLIFTDYLLKTVSSYVDFGRPKLQPACNYLFLCKNSTQLANLGDIFGRMVYQAVGSYANPTRYRQIIETASSEFLSPQEQDAISYDQKHASNVAKVHYQKKRSRRVAEKAMCCMEKLIRSSQNENATTENETEETENEMEANDNEIQVTLSETATRRRNTRKRVELAVDKVPIKEVVHQAKNTRKKKNAFTKEEDNFLLKGLKKYGQGKLTHILNDPEYKFHPSRKNSTLMMRARAKKYT